MSGERRKDLLGYSGAAAWRLQKLTSILKKEKGRMKAGTEERRKFQIK